LFDFNGILFFPVTPFTADGEVDVAVFGQHVKRGLDKGARIVFAACGTGEYFALDDAEAGRVITEAVARCAGRAPVFVGAGGGVGPARTRIAQAAAAGADGVLLFAPDGLIGGTAGLVEYVTAVAETSELPIIAYQRGAMRFDVPATVQLAGLPQVIGLKEGLGDIELVRRQVATVQEVRPDFVFINGLPTAELTMAAYRSVGVEYYSSAVFAFAPDIAVAFNQGAFALKVGHRVLD